MSEENKAYLQLHVAVLLFGISAILGDLISLDSLSIVWWRLLLSSVILGVWLAIAGRFKKLSGKDLRRALLIGVFVSLHWYFFFASIKTANASVSLVCLSTVSFMTALVEPYFFRKKHSPLEIFLGILIIPGMILIVNSLDPSYYLGIVYGLLSAFFAMIFSILNKDIVTRHSPYLLTFIEISFGWIIICLLMLFYWLFSDYAFIFYPTGMDWTYLIALALGVTVIGFSLALNALKHLSAFASNLTINLEPVYGIILAIVILEEDRELSNKFYIGAGMIILSVIGYPILKRLFKISTA